MRVNHRQRAHIFMLAGVFGLMVVTLYMAFGFPSALLQLKQSDTTELKGVILIGGHGEVTPPRDVYFEAYGEEPPEQWYSLGGPNQLTNMGKERMYLLGKFLRLRYYEKLLKGNPKRLLVRSENSDKCLESAQALIAGLNPPANNWFWSTSGTSKSSSSMSASTLTSGGSPSTDNDLAHLWQPKSVHTTSEQLDDLLSSKTRCLTMDSLQAHWKNTTRYAHLLNEFRHDLQILRQNTGLEFEDDLEMLANIEDQLRARSSLTTETNDSPPMPSWYTSTFASRLAHVADATAGCRFSQIGTQRLYVGRLLDTITKNIFGKIRSDLTSGLSMLGGGSGGDSDGLLDNDEEDDGNDRELGQVDENDPTVVDFNKTIAASKRDKGANSRGKGQQEEILIRKNKLLPPEERAKLKLAHHTEPNVFVYMTDKQHLTALLNSLKIYSSQTHYGALLIIELHYDSANQIHFLRMFTVNSFSHNVLPEPVRVNPIACLDSVECSPQQFERNIRHLRLDKLSWQRSCQVADDSGHGGSGSGAISTPSSNQMPDSGTPTPTSQPPTQAPKSQQQQQQQAEPTERSDKVTSETTEAPVIDTSAKLEALVVTPSSGLPASNSTLASNSTTASNSTSTSNPTTASNSTTTTIDTLSDESASTDDHHDSQENENKHDDLDDNENLLVGPTNTKPISSANKTGVANNSNGNNKDNDDNEQLVTAITPTLVEIDRTATSDRVEGSETALAGTEAMPLVSPANMTTTTHH
uniref:2-phosphoxylose phosphatase 1 n=1 Tax=Aceria tosichella TaxID=561515 RepID=A0A6G1SKS0_9ACAR